MVMCVCRLLVMLTKLWLKVRGVLLIYRQLTIIVFGFFFFAR